jgi:hypothetical protein
MALIDKLKPSQKKQKPIQANNPILPSKDSLDIEEITLILGLIKNTTFKGENIETLYNLIVKLQNQYIKLENV